MLMRRKTLALTLTSALLCSVVTGAWLVSLAAANGIPLPQAAPYVPPPDNPPAISLRSPSNSTYNVNNITLRIVVTLPLQNDTEIVSVAYHLDGIEYVVANYGRYSFSGHRVTDLPNPLNFTKNLYGLSEGAHTLRVTVASRSSATYVSVMVVPYDYPVEYDTAYSELVWSHSEINFTIDTTPPKISILKLDNQTATETSLSFAVSEPVTWIGYSLDGQGNVTINGNITLPELTYGHHNITVFANDTAGNIGATESINFSISKGTDPLSTTLIIAASGIFPAVIATGLLTYFKKRKH
jgi:hypothetical protein